MDSQYERYKQIRDLAWETLIKHKISELPTDVWMIAEEYGVLVQDYGQAEGLINYCGLQNVAEANEAFCVYTDRWRVLHKSAGEEETRYAVAHELGHILLKHEMKKHEVGYFTVYYSDFNREEYTSLADEQEVRDFAVRILAPACVIIATGVESAAELAELCHMPPFHAHDRFSRIISIIEKNRLYESNLEMQVYEQFNTGFIEDYLKKKKRKEHGEDGWTESVF
jgi:Zn-dependent peptidase ImmA (M78 family)